MTVHPFAGAQVPDDELVDVVLYAESFQGMDHLRRIEEEARAIVVTALAGRTP
jgi:hypothetical protein